MDNELIRWKTDAWKSPQMVSSYAATMHAVGGTNRLKNQIEVELCGRFARGSTVLDVGVGTGRAAIPLARAGHAVTGVDISTAMLEQCAREGAGLSLRLLQGDVAALPFTGERFDTVLALNTVVHFPHWQAILEEWRRVVAPGGRMIFDVHTRDHVEAVAAASGRPYEQIVAGELKDHSSYMLRVAARDVFAYARERKLTVRALVPYASIFGGGNRNYWLDEHPLLGPGNLARLYSWFGSDPALLAFAVFLEQKIVAALSPASTGRMMIVIDDVEDAAANDALEARLGRIDAAFARGLAAADLAEIFGGDLDAVRDGLAAHLAHEPNRTFLGVMLAGSRTHRALGAALGLVPAEARAFAERVVARCRADADVTALVARWPQAVPPEYRTFAGVDLAPSLAYDLTRSFAAARWFDAERVTAS